MYAERILKLKKTSKIIYVRIKEPKVFRGRNIGRKRLEDAGVAVVIVEGMEQRILEGSTMGNESGGRW